MPVESRLGQQVLDFFGKSKARALHDSVEKEMLVDGQLVEEDVELRAETNLSAGLSWVDVDAVAVDVDLAGSFRVVATYDVDQCCFASSIVTE